jgi:hypothetical protein
MSAVIFNLRMTLGLHAHATVSTAKSAALLAEPPKNEETSAPGWSQARSTYKDAPANSR